MRRALIIVDMQYGSFVGTPRHADGLVDRLNTLARSVRANGDLVVFVQHTGVQGDAHHPSQPGWQVLPDLIVADEDVLVGKTACDAFLGTDLEATLASREIKDDRHGMRD